MALKESFKEDRIVNSDGIDFHFQWRDSQFGTGSDIGFDVDKQHLFLSSKDIVPLTVYRPTSSIRIPVHFTSLMSRFMG
jgi:hypothetical protein